MKFDDNVIKINQQNNDKNDELYTIWINNFHHKCGLVKYIDNK